MWRSGRPQHVKFWLEDDVTGLNGGFRIGGLSAETSRTVFTGQGFWTKPMNLETRGIRPMKSDKTPNLFY